MNAVDLEHPTSALLTAYGLGQLGEEELALVDGHLAECDICRQAVEGVPPDTLMTLLRSAATEPDDHHSADEGVRGAPPCEPGVERASAAVPPAALVEHPRYRVGELLGVGGMGAVYKAEHLLMQRPVALKVLNHELIDRPENVERFRREVRAAARLAHPHIVAAFDAEQAGDTHFLAMEYVEGISLARRCLEHGPLPVAEACAYTRQAALGLQHAHECGMVHRDIKPQNLMLTRDGQLKILDFGLSRFVMESAPAGALLPAEGAPVLSTVDADVKVKPLTQIGVVMGTPDYIAPEQARDSHEADIRADIYSLGCTLYDMLAGHAPFPDGNAAQKVKAHLHQTPPPLKTLRRDVPLELVKIVERMMAKGPAQRYQTPAEVAAALAPFTCAKPPRRGWRLIAAALGLIAAVLAGVVIYVQTDRGTIVIETKDDAIAVMIEKAGGVKIVDQANQREYHLRPGEQDVPSGSYLIEVTEALAGLDFQVKRFELKRGKEVRVTATFAAKGEAQAKAPPLDRKRAQERLNIWKDIVNQKQLLYENGHMSLDKVIEARRDVAKIELELCETPEERIKIYETLARLAQEFVNVRAAQFKSGLTLEVELLQAKANLLEAQAALESAQANRALPVQGAATVDRKNSQEIANDPALLYGGKPASYWLTQYKDANPKYRAEAIEALGTIARKDKDLIPVVLGALKDEHDEVGQAASSALSWFGAAVVPTVTDVLKDRTSSQGMRNAAKTLSRIGSAAKTAVPFLADALQVESRDVKLAVISALGRIGPDAKPAIPAMVNVLGAELKRVADADPTPVPSGGKRNSLVGPGTLFRAAKDAILKIDPDLKAGFPTKGFDGGKEGYAAMQAGYEALRKIYPVQASARGQGAAPVPKLSEELARFQGTWSIVKQQVKWKIEPPLFKYVISGDVWTIMNQTQVFGVMTFKVDPTKHPNAIDLHLSAEDNPGASPRRGIYEFKDDTLIVCFRTGGQERPTGFVDTEGSMSIAYLKKDTMPEERPAIGPKNESAKNTEAAKSQGLFYGGKPASYWLDALRDADPNFRVQAIKALGHIARKNKEVIPVLVEQLRDGSPLVRLEAVRAVGSVAPKNEAMKTALVKLLGDKDFLAYFQPDMVPALMEVLSDKPTPIVVRNSASLLREMGAGAKDAVPILVKLLSVEVDGEVFAALGAIGPDAMPAIPKLTDLLGELLKEWNLALSQNRPGARESVASGIAKAVAQIDTMLVNKLPDERRLRELKKVSPDYLKRLILAYQDFYDALRKRYPADADGGGQAASGSNLKHALYRGKPASHWLAQYKDANPKFRAEAIEALGTIAQTDKELIPVVVGALKDEHDEVGKAASSALSLLGAAVVPSVIEVLKDRTSFDGMRNAATALSQIGPTAKAAVPYLADALKVESGDVKLEAITALRRIGPDAKPAIPALVYVLGVELKRVALAGPPAKTGTKVSGQGGKKKTVTFARNTLHRAVREAMLEIDHDLKAAFPKELEPDFEGSYAAIQVAHEALQEKYPLHAPGSGHTEAPLPVLNVEKAKIQGPLYGGKPASYWLLQYKDPNPKYRTEAIEALGAIARTDKELIPLVVGALRDNDEGVWKAASSALSFFGAAVVPAVIDILKDRSSSESMHHAAYAIGRIGPPAKAAVPVLADILKAESVNVRLAMVRALGQIGPDAKPAIPALIDVLGAELKKEAGIMAAPGAGKKGQSGEKLLVIFGPGTLPRIVKDTIFKIDPELKRALTNEAEFEYAGNPYTFAVLQKFCDDYRKRYPLPNNTETSKSREP